MRAPAKFSSLALLLLAGCSHVTAVDLTVQLGGDVQAHAAQITTLRLQVTGDTAPFDRKLALSGKFGSGKETLEYLPGVKTGTLEIIVTLLDASGAIIGSGNGSAVIKSGSSTAVTISIGSGASGAMPDLIMTPPLDMTGAPPPADLYGTIPPDMTGDVTPPRPVWPQNGGNVTSLKPTMRWELLGGADGAHIQLCTDAACTMVLQTLDVLGSSTNPPAALPGVTTKVFWRMAGRSGGVVGMSWSPTWSFRTPFAGTAVDTSYGITLDLNGDGYDDLAVGALGGTGKGAVYVYLGSSSGIVHANPTVLSEPGGGAVGNYFGVSVKAAGDVDGDGYGDLIVGASQASAQPSPGPGHAYIFFGSKDGISTTRTPITLNVPLTDVKNQYNNGPAFGCAVSTAGDVNADGYADVIVGAFFDSPVGFSGKAYVFHGNSGGPGATPSSTITGISGAAYIGQAVAEAGDVNGDGYDDVIVGAPLGDGIAAVYTGSANGLGANPAPSSKMTNAGSNEGLGGAVAGGGDIDSNGYADVAVGGTQSGSGHVYIYTGSMNGLGATPAAYKTLPLAAQALATGDVFGRSVVMAQTLVIVGANCAPYNGSCNTGAAYAYSVLNSAAPDQETLARTDVPAVGDNFGYAVQTGDFNNDGYPDFCVGAPFSNTNAGSAYVFVGGAFSGNINPTQSGATLSGAAGNFGYGL